MQENLPPIRDAFPVLKALKDEGEYLQPYLLPSLLSLPPSFPSTLPHSDVPSSPLFLFHRRRRPHGFLPPSFAPYVHWSPSPLSPFSHSLSLLSLSLPSGVDFHVVTSRQFCIQRETEEWVQKHYPGIFTGLHYGNHYSGTVPPSSLRPTLPPLPPTLTCCIQEAKLSHYVQSSTLDPPSLPPSLPPQPLDPNALKGTCARPSRLSSWLTTPSDMPTKSLKTLAFQSSSLVRGTC